MYFPDNYYAFQKYVYKEKKCLYELISDIIIIFIYYVYLYLPTISKCFHFIIIVAYYLFFHNVRFLIFFRGSMFI